MKLYNPFKPHVVKRAGYYYVRKLTVIPLWGFLDATSCAYWWSLPPGLCRYCKFDSIEDAKSAIKKYKHERMEIV